MSSRSHHCIFHPTFALDQVLHRGHREVLQQKGNECLIKTPCHICRRIVAPFCRVAYAAIIVETLSSHLRKDKYNKKIQKFLVDVDDDEEDYGHDEERETQESETEELL